MSERVWGIPCPWSGDDNEAVDWRYRAWFWLYRTNQRMRHRLGRHQKPRTYSIAPRCDWCGHRSPKQRAIAEANWTATPTPAPTPEPQRAEPGVGG